VHGLRILVVEDTDLLRRMYKDRLILDGYEVFDAPDGLAALAVLRDQSVDLVLLDLIMPRMGGLQVLEAIKNDPRTSALPVVILTNLGEEETIEQAMALGAVDYLIKNETRPADVSEKVRLTLEAFGMGPAATTAFRVFPDKTRGDIEGLIADAGLKRKGWCPACEHELALELVPAEGRQGWYEAHFICPGCGRDYAAQ
jgi:CheY-like chemotaxis protein